MFHSEKRSKFHPSDIKRGCVIVHWKMQNWKSAKEPIVILLKVDTKIDGRLDKEAGYVQ